MGGSHEILNANKDPPPDKIVDAPPESRCELYLKNSKTHDYLTRNTRAGLFFLIGYTSAWLVLYFAWWAVGFSGEKKACTYKPDKDCFCEAFSFANPLGQTTLTITNLAYVFVGIGILVYYYEKANRRVSTSAPVPADPGSPARTPENCFEDLSAYSFLYALLVVNIGISSWFMHASGYKWAGLFDTYCMHMFISYVLLYSLADLRGWSLKSFLLVFLVFEVFLLVLNVTNVFGIMSRNDLFGILVGVTVGFEILVLAGIRTGKIGNHHARDWRYLLLAVLSFVIAFIIWNLQKTEIWPCDPYALIQPHALWHIITAISTAFIFQYIRSENLSP